MTKDYECMKCANVNFADTYDFQCGECDYVNDVADHIDRLEEEVARLKGAIIKIIEPIHALRVELEGRN